MHYLKQTNIIRVSEKLYCDTSDFKFNDELKHHHVPD